MTTAANARRDYRHFPAAYGELIHRFNDKGSASVGPMSKKEANVTRRDLYRFRTFLSAAVDADPSDAFARELLDIFSRVVLNIEPIATVDPRGSHCIVLSLNPVTAWIEGTQQ
jgi:hypothetical protein